MIMMPKGQMRAICIAYVFELAPDVDRRVRLATEHRESDIELEHLPNKGDCALRPHFSETSANMQDAHLPPKSKARLPQ